MTTEEEHRLGLNDLVQFSGFEDRTGKVTELDEFTVYVQGDRLNGWFERSDLKLLKTAEESPPPPPPYDALEVVVAAPDGGVTRYDHAEPTRDRDGTLLIDDLKVGEICGSHPPAEWASYTVVRKDVTRAVPGRNWSEQEQAAHRIYFEHWANGIALLCTCGADLGFDEAAYVMAEEFDLLREAHLADLAKAKREATGMTLDADELEVLGAFLSDEILDPGARGPWRTNSKLMALAQRVRAR